MVDAIISPLLEQLTSMAVEEAKEQVRLVTGVGKEAKKLTSNLRAIQAVLHDAERRQVKEETVRLWLDQLRDSCYDMEDVLGEWNTARLKLQINKKKFPRDDTEWGKEWIGVRYRTFPTSTWVLTMSEEGHEEFLITN